LATAAQGEFSSLSTGRSGSEFDLLCACCRVSDTGPSIEEAISPNLDWDGFLKLASFHRVLPAVHAALKCQADVPASILSALDARFTSHVKRVLRFSAELAGIVRQFENAGIEVLCHKGPVLAQHLYGDATAREFGDLDFLVRPRDVQQARAILCDLGYLPRLTVRGEQEREYIRIGYEYVFGSAAGPNVVELQWQIVPRFYAVNFQIESFFDRSIEIEFEGQRVRSLRNQDLLLVLCMHAAKHGWSQLGMVRDIAAVSRRDIDWNAAVKEAQQLGIIKILAISLKLTKELPGTELPEGFTSSHLGFDGDHAQQIRRRMSCAEELRTDSFQYFRGMMNLRERWRDQLRFLWRLAATPTLGEWQAVDLPEPLFPLYRAVRAWRLAARGFRGLTSSLRSLTAPAQCE
jgi:hypothetical protein